VIRRIFSSLVYLLLAVIFGCVLALTGPQFNLAYAAGEFATTYDITYEVNEQGKAVVVSDISLINKLSNIYATQYQLTLERGDISGILAWDNKGAIKTEVEKQDEATLIRLKFNDQIVGVGKNLRFTLKYEISDFAKKNGQIWEIAVPRILDLKESEVATVAVKVPLSFGSPAFISPLPNSTSETKFFQILNFSKERIGDKPIIIALGEFQIFDFSLTYHLSNSKAAPVFTKIAFPPDTNYQKIAYNGIQPKPENIEVDGDGNWLGTYTLSPLEKKIVRATGKVKIWANPNTERGAKQDLKKYLTPQSYWEVEDPEIKKLAASLKTPEAIYNYVVDNLNYDFSKVGLSNERLGAQAVLKKKNNAICLEFTDLFIALARAAGIPARELNGFAYTENPKLKPLSAATDILHSWPEFYDTNKRLWVQIDPTWGKTSGVDFFHKLDLSHFVFAIHGADSRYPPAAGSYREENAVGKDIKVSFGEYKEEKIPEINVIFNLPKAIFPGQNVSGSILVTNLGPGALYNVPISIESRSLSLSSPVEMTIESLVPFAQKEIPVSFNRRISLKAETAKVDVLVNGENFSYNLQIEPILFQLLLILLISASLIVIIVLSAKARRLSLPQQ